MSQQDTAHAWWSRLRHQGLLLSPVVMLERFPAAPEPAPFHKTARLRDAYTRFVSTGKARQDEVQLEQSAILAWTDALLEHYIGHGKTRIASQHSIPDNLTAAIRISNKSDTIRPHRVVFADDERKTPALLVMADTSHIVGRGRGRTTYARFLELLRGTGHRLGLLTNGHQFRLVYAGLDFESWCEWESDRWFDDGDGTEELNGLRQLLSPDALKPIKEGTSGLLDAVEESRKRQADLSSVLRENVRQAVELLLEEVSAVNRTNQNLFASLVAAGSERPLTDAEAHEALLQATVRLVMRLVVCLFAESRQLLPVDFPIYAQAYGVRSLYELLEETTRNEGGTHGLMNRSMAWPRLMALFRLIHGGSAHGAFELRPYGGALFRPGDDKSAEPVARALHILEHAVTVCDATIYHVLRKLLRGPLPVLRGRAKTFVEGPVDYTDLRTEFIGLIYEGLLDYKLKRTDEKIGPQVFLNLGREPVLPLSRLNEMLQSDKKGLKDLLTTLRKEKVTASAAAEEEAEEEAEEPEEGEEETEAEVEVQVEPVAAEEGVRGGDYLDAVESAKSWAKEAVILAGLVGKQKAKEPNSEYQGRIEAEATKLIKKVVATGEFYLVRAGNTRKGTGTFYTRPQLAVPTVHRTLEPLCYIVDRDSWIVDRQTNQGETHASAELSGPSGLAAGDGPRDADLSAHGEVSQGGDLRTDQPASASGSVGSVEHRRGPGENEYGRVPESTIGGTRVDHGSANPSGNRTTAQLSAGDRDSGAAGLGDTSSSDDERTHQRSQAKAMTPRKPEEILGLKVCDPACGSASFLVAALHYLTDALYLSLCHHCKLDEPESARRLTLPYGRPRSTTHDPRSTTEELVPFPPNDPQRGHTFEDRVKALLRRHVVERCIYGVDINPLAVEFARVSLWVETLDPELPFSFLDHKIKVGNSLVGCWLDRVEDYPLKAWERDGGDGKKGARTQRIETLLKGELQGNRRPGDGRIKQEMRDLVERRFSQQPHLFADDILTTTSVANQACAEYEKLHELPIGDPDERERYYREHIEESQPLRTLKAAMDEWCAVWFWPTDEASLRHAPTPHNLYAGEELCADTVIAVAGQVRFFHWELEFPDVFTPTRRGFDAMIGNPPWDVMKPNSQEFFTDFDPLYRLYDKQEALRQQARLFAAIPGLHDQWDEYNARFKALANWVGKITDPFDLALARGKEGEALQSAWARHRQKRLGFADAHHPFRLQGSADLNSYKLFAEFFWNLLRPDGRLGVILPTGIYSDFGTRALREEFLFRGRLEFLYAFQNEKRVFSAAHHSYKQTALFATKGGSTQSFRTRFRMGVGDSPTAQEIPDDILRNDQAAMLVTPDEVRGNSPKTLSLVELRSQHDLDIFRKIYAHSIRIGDNAPGWEITYATEFHMTNDSKHFPPLEKWEAKGYKPDVFGRWIGPEGDVALPLYQGRIIHQLDFWKAGYVEGKGASAVWRAVPPEDKKIEPLNLMALETFREFCGQAIGTRVIYRDIARNTDNRTMIASCVPAFPCNNKVPLLTTTAPIDRQLTLTAILDSFAFDWTLRNRLSGASLNWYIIDECPLPAVPLIDVRYRRLALTAASFTFLHRRFAPEWLRLKHLYPDLAQKEWKHWWAVTEADRLRLRVGTDAMCADLYGLDPDDFDWIVRDDPKDPKGFYRVDRHLPFRERLTGLAAAAFRALKEGKWSAESAAKLTNDEFFALIGIPEMTTGPEPLIRKRDGCHRWKPEEFGKDNPRHGWTWDHCWQDAVALLGSEDAVRDYIEGKHEKAGQKPAEEDGAKDLFGERLPPKQGSLLE